MIRRNGATVRSKVAERRGHESEGEAVRARCQVCDRPLPLGLVRHYCLEHSAYPQRLLQRLSRISAA